MSPNFHPAKIADQRNETVFNAGSHLEVFQDGTTVIIDGKGPTKR